MKIRIIRKNKKPLEEAAAGPQDLDDSTKLICTDDGDEIKIKYSESRFPLLGRTGVITHLHWGGKRSKVLPTK